MTPTKPHIFLFHGPDTYSSAHKIRIWTSEFAKKHGANNSIVLDCQERDVLPVSVMKNFFGIHSLFGYTKLAVLRNVWTKEGKEAAEYLAETIADLPTTYFLVIHAEHADARTTVMKRIGELEKQGRASIEHFAIPAGAELAQWIDGQIARRGGSITRDALRHFTQNLEGTGYKDGATHDLWSTNNDIRKLLSFADGAPIERHMVELLASRGEHAHAFDLMDAILIRNAAESFRIVHELLADQTSQAKSAAFGILALLKSQLKSFVMVKELASTYSDADIARTLSWNPKRVYVVKRKITPVSQERLISMLSDVLDRESDIFFTPLTPLTAIDLLLIKLLAK